MTTIAICAHTSRAQQAHKLMADTGAAYLSMDNGLRGCTGNHRHCWEWLNTHADGFGVVLEDDAVIDADFRHQLEQALKAAPATAPIISGYLGQQRPPQWQPRIRNAIQRADQADANYIIASNLLHAVCVAVRADHIKPLLDYTSTRTGLPWDEAISAYARHSKTHVAYLWPSIVDHADEPTITPHRDNAPRPPGRVAWRVGSRPTWTDTTVTL